MITTYKTIVKLDPQENEGGGGGGAGLPDLPSTIMPPLQSPPPALSPGSGESKETSEQPSGLPPGVTHSKEEEFSLEDFAKGRREVKPKQEEKKEAPQEKKEEKKEEGAKPEEKKDSSGEEKKEEKLDSPFPSLDKLKKVGKGAQARDYSGFSEEEVKNLKQMSNSAFELFKSQRKELEELKKKQGSVASNGEKSQQTQHQEQPQQPKYLYEHPEAYVLDPRYKGAVENLGKLRGERDYWEEQLLKIKQGEDWVDYVPTADGKWAPVTKKASIQAEMEVTRYMSNATQMLSEGQRSIQQFVAAHQQAHGQLIGAIKQAERNFFPDYEDKNNPSQKQIENAIRFLSERGLGSNPLTPMVAKFYVRCQEYLRALQEASKEVAIEASKKEDSKLANPPSSGITAGVESSGGGNGKGEYSLEMFGKPA